MDTALVVTSRPQLPQATPKKRYPGHKILSGTRAAFIKAFERNFGNISLSCREVGIDRKTYYRWIASDTPINVKFRQKLERVRPEDHHIDMLEAAHTELVRKLDPAAVIFGLKTKGRKRGWNERELPDGAVVVTKEAFEQVVEAFRAWLDDYRDAPEEEKVKWLCRFADNSGVDCKKLAERVGVQLPEGHEKK